MKIPVGLKTPIHKHPSPMLIHVTRGKLKHVRGRVINTFRAGNVFVESNNGGEHYVKSIGKKNCHSSCWCHFSSGSTNNYQQIKVFILINYKFFL